MTKIISWNNFNKQYKLHVFILCVCIWSKSGFVTLANDLLSDDFFLNGRTRSHNPHKEIIKVPPRHVELGQPCISISYTHRKSGENQSQVENKQKHTSSDKLSRFELLETIPEIRCGLEKGTCPTNSPIVDITLSRPEQREGFRLVGDSDGDVFPCYPLTDADFRRSRSAVPGSTRRLLEVARKARAGQTVNVVVIGGSVSHGGACKSYMFEESDHKEAGPCSWANRFVIWMRQHYHNPNIHLISLAQPATTTTWILTHFERVLKRNPDLLLVEYGVNDAIVSSSESGKLQFTSMMRAATELLIRKYLQHNEAMNTDNAILYVVLQRSFDERSYFYPSEVYYPVCKAYGVPVVSVRDAIWPDQDMKRESLWVTKSGAHPIWFGHQLICDVLAYAWTIAEHEEKYGRQVEVSEPRATGSTLKFGAGVSSVDVCSGKNMLRSSLSPVRSPGQGWSWIDRSTGKEGWEYNLHHQTGLSIEWAAGTHEHELAGRRRLRSGLVRKKSKRVAKAYGLMQGIDNSVLQNMASDLKGSDDWIPKDKPEGDEEEDDAEGVQIGTGNDDGKTDDQTFDSLNFGAPKKIAPRKRDGKSMMGIRRKNRKKKEMEEQAALDRRNEDQHYVLEHGQELGVDAFDVEKLWGPTPAPFTDNSATPAPTSQLDIILPGIISFPLNFTTAHNNTPTLLLEHLKSWTGYGQAVVWVTRKHSPDTVGIELEKEARLMLKMVLTNSLYVTQCESMIFDDHSKLKFSPSCSHIRAGTWVDPTVIDGHWEDHSSQIVSAYRIGGLRLENDPHITSSPPHAVIDPALSLFQTTTKDPISDDAQVVEGEVHVMMVPWSHKKHGMLHQTKFKIFAIYSC